MSRSDSKDTGDCSMNDGDYRINTDSLEGELDLLLLRVVIID
jgi:hypothetical protein